MARIKTDRPEAMAYNGQEATFVRDVVDNEPAYSQFVDQVVVNIGGHDLYFFASEVTLSEGEEKKADKDRKAFEREAQERREAAGTAREGKKAWLANYKRGAEMPDDQKPTPTTGGIAPASIPAHQGVSGAGLVGETNKFNPVPGSPPKPEEPVTATGKEGLPLGSGSDPQGRRESAADQSKSNPSERPVPGAQAPQGSPEK